MSKLKDLIEIDLALLLFIFFVKYVEKKSINLLSSWADGIYYRYSCSSLSIYYILYIYSCTA